MSFWLFGPLGVAFVLSHLNPALKVLPMLQPGEPFRFKGRTSRVRGSVLVSWARI